MGGKEINFGDKNINKKDFYKSKKLFKIEDIDINKILISKIESYGKKGSGQYIIGYDDDGVITPLQIRLPQMIGYAKYFYKNNKRMSLVADDKELFKKYTKIWKQINGLIGRKFSSEPVGGDKYINSKIKSYKDSVITNFQGNKVPKEGFSCVCHS